MQEKLGYISNHYIMTQFDFFLSDSVEKRPMKFSEEAHKSGRWEVKHFENIYEYEMFRDFHGFANTTVDDVLDSIR